MDGFKIEIIYSEGYGWRPRAYGVINGHTVSYTGEHRPTLTEANARLMDALAVYDLLDKAS
jgi:hypothetical protein